MKSKRPWKKFAYIDRIELNSKDVKFEAFVRGWVETGKSLSADTSFGRFESVLEAEQALDGWYANWWPKQTKSVRRA